MLNNIKVKTNKIRICVTIVIHSYVEKLQLPVLNEQLHIFKTINSKKVLKMTPIGKQLCN